MATYVGETSFSKLTRVTEQAKAMLNSWSVNNNNSVGKDMDFNPVIPNQVGNMNRNPHNNSYSREDYQNYGWLFGFKG